MAATVAHTPLQLVDLHSDILSLIAEHLTPFEVWRLEAAIGKPFVDIADRYYRTKCRRFVAFPFSSALHNQCLTENRNVFDGAHDYIEDLTVTYHNGDYEATLFNNLLETSSFPRLRRLHLQIDESDFNNFVMPVPNLIGVEELRFTGFRCNKSLNELAALNETTLKSIEFVDTRFIEHFSALPLTLTKLVFRRLDELAIEKFVRYLSNVRLNRSSGITHFEYTGSPTCNVSPPATSLLLGNIFLELRSTVQTMIIDTWLLPQFANLHAPNTVCTRLTLHLNCLTMFGQSLDLLKALHAVEHLSMSGRQYGTIQLPEMPSKYSALLKRLKSLELVDCVFYDDAFIEFAKRIPTLSLTMRNVTISPEKANKVQFGSIWDSVPGYEHLAHSDPVEFDLRRYL